MIESIYTKYIIGLRHVCHLYLDKLLEVLSMQARRHTFSVSYNRYITPEIESSQSLKGR